jgi:glycosyltransferase involved in cell wall biosynthesis
MASNISVCMAVKNGAAYLHDQLTSILPQLAGDDEIIISDDHSSDESIQVIEQFNDSRITILQNPGQGLISNFENAIRHATGTYIFLADQDDVWMHNKVEETLLHLRNHALVVTDCAIVTSKLGATGQSFFQLNNSRSGILYNLIKNSYMGCCMAFHKKVLTKALPFPEKIPMHDAWLGLMAELHFNVKFVDQKLLYHRRHTDNASTTSLRSSTSVIHKMAQRFWLLKNILTQSHVN